MTASASGLSGTMSPALLNKYLGAARQVAEHLVLTPTGLAFAPHPVVTNTDRDKYCVKRILAFYQAQPTDLAEYFRVCWQHRQTSGSNLADLANSVGEFEYLPSVGTPETELSARSRELVTALSR